MSGGITISFLDGEGFVQSKWCHSWRSIGSHVFVDMFGRTRVENYGEEPLLHNPYGPAIQYDNEAPIYYMHGHMVDEDKIASKEKTWLRTLDIYQGPDLENLKIECWATFVPRQGDSQDHWLVWLRKPGDQHILAAAPIYLSDCGNLAFNVHEKAADFFRTSRFGNTLVRHIQDCLWNTNLGRSGSALEEKIKDVIERLRRWPKTVAESTEKNAPVAIADVAEKSAGLGAAFAIAAASAVATAIASKCSQSFVGVPQEATHAA